MFKIPFKVKRTVDINETPEKVFKTIADFNSWKKWSFAAYVA